MEEMEKVEISESVENVQNEENIEKKKENLKRLSIRITLIKKNQNLNLSKKHQKGFIILF